MLGDRLGERVEVGLSEGSGEGEEVTTKDGRMVGLIVGLRLGRADLSRVGFDDVMLCGDRLS